MTADAASRSAHLRSRMKFTAEEDAVLTCLVGKLGADWHQISRLMKDRTPRQCRERYRHYLDPSLDNGPWSASEEALLIRLVSALGPNWVTMRSHFPGRSNTNIKNHWTAMRRADANRHPNPFSIEALLAT
jgi:hypothetical protein